MFRLFWVSDSIKEDKNLMTLDREHSKDDENITVWQVALDIIEENDFIVILAPIAWVDLDDIDITTDDSILTISWDRKKPEIYYESWIIKNTECFWWKFIRNIILPDNMDLDNIKAVMENNLLVITVPKIRFDTKSIKINKID